MGKTEFDALVVGSGPNGFAAAIAMQQQGLDVLILEAKETIGGGMRSAELTLPGFTHDICSAVHPLARASPFFSQLPLSDFGLTYIEPTLAAAHPFDSAQAAVLYRSIRETAGLFGADEVRYESLLEPLVKDWPLLRHDLLGPLRVPHYPIKLAKFGLQGFQSITKLAAHFNSPMAKGFFAGMGAHSMQPLSNLTTAAVALVLLMAGHDGGWSIPAGGSQSIANALEAYFLSLGGRIETNTEVTSLAGLPSARAVLLDVTPRALLQIAGHRISSFERWQLHRFRYGMGVFKIDWALDKPIPFEADACRKAGTVHIGNTLAEIVTAERKTFSGTQPDKPFVLLSQPSLFDPSRAPAGKHTAWAYCHAPAGSSRDVTALIEKQVERFAPGFSDCILGRHTMNALEIEAYNPNYIGGDINAGVLDLGQLFTRPSLRWSPYNTSAKGIYLCSSSTPPGGGVHGMCGYYAAKQALRDIFNIRL